jgi:hypothetical protein
MKGGAIEVSRLKSGVGQHSIEFAFLIGLVTIAVVAMQHYARLRLQAGIKMASDLILDVPPPPTPSTSPPRTISVVDCNGATRSATGADHVLMVACSDVDERGDPSFLRVTDIRERTRGVAVNQERRLQVISQ